MNKLKELINKLCPNGVKFEELKEICMVSIGEFVHKNKQREDAKYPVFNGGISNTGFYDEYNNEGNKILISARGANAGFINKRESRYWAGNSCYSIDVKDKSSINWLYVYYYLKNNEKNLLGQQQTGSIPAISKKQIESFKIAVPPLEVQCEIVHILDDFTLLSALLSAELKARQQQYEYYKNELYSFKDKDVKYVKLKEIAEIYRGGNFQKKDFTKNGKPCIHYGQIYTKYGKTANKTYTFVNDTVFEKSKQAGKNDIVMAVTSENIEDVCKCVVWLGNENIAVSGHTAIIHTKINARYLGYYFSTLHFFIDKAKLAHGTKVIEVTPSSLNDILIPVPSEEEQENIASKVEKFEKLCNDISEGLPAEIEARQKQYEYYRDKLLTFKELKVNE